MCISCRYDWMLAFAMFMSLCVDVMVMSSVLLVPVVLGLSDVYIMFFVEHHF